MRFTAVCLLLALGVLLHPPSSAACLQLLPDTCQLFRYDTVSLSCAARSDCSRWTVKRNTSRSGVRACSSGWGSASSASSCTIGNIYPTDSGVYWCESDGGEQSTSVHLTVTDRSVILQSPALPVSEGAAVTLRCRAEASSADHTFRFYKDGRLIGSGSSGHMTLPGVSKSDEGLYKCGVSGGEESLASLMSVDASLLSPPSELPAASCPRLVFSMTCRLLVGAPYLLSTLVLALIFRDRRTAATRTVAVGRGSCDVVMETVE